MMPGAAGPWPSSTALGPVGIFVTESMHVTMHVTMHFTILSGSHTRGIRGYLPSVQTARVKLSKIA